LGLLQARIRLIRGGNKEIECDVGRYRGRYMGGEDNETVWPIQAVLACQQFCCMQMDYSCKNKQAYWNLKLMYLCARLYVWKRGGFASCQKHTTFLHARSMESL
jgi:hypothetical protein